MQDADIPLLMAFLFREKAQLVQEEASERLLRWCGAFDDWLAERGKANPKYRQRLELAWKQLLDQTNKPPWEITDADIDKYRAWLETEDRAPRTIYNYMVAVSSFYRWCNQHHGEAHNDMSYNPVRDAPRPRLKRLQCAKVLSREEACALLAVLKLDDCILTKRDYAFFLARLRLGLSFRDLQQLQWGEIEVGEHEVWLNFRHGKKRHPLPQDAYRAILDYLGASGRLAGIRPKAYIFAPLSDPLRQEASGKAEDWDESRYLVTTHFNTILKTYGGLAGIAEEKLTLPALRHTAAMLRMEAGDSLEAIQASLDHARLSYTKYYLKLLPVPPREGAHLRDLANDPPRLPERKAPHFKPGDNLKHGLYAQEQPAEEIAAILVEDIQGMGEQISVLRAMCRSLMAMQKKATNAEEVALLADAYTLAVTRLGEIIRIEKQRQNLRSEDSRAEQLLAALVKSAQADGEEIDIDTAREMALASDLEYGAAAWRLVEEMAATRLALRRVHQMALESEKVAEHAHLIEVYGRGCGRLARLLKGEGIEHSRLEAVMNDLIDEVTADVNREFGVV